MGPFKCYVCLQPACEFPQDFKTVLTELTAVFCKLNSHHSNCSQVTPLALCQSCWCYLMKIHQSHKKLSLLNRNFDDKIAHLSAKIGKVQSASSSPFGNSTAEQPADSITLSSSSSAPSEESTIGQLTEPVASETSECDSEPEEDDSDEEDWPPEGIVMPPNSLVVKRVSKKKFIYREKFRFKGKDSGFQCGSCPSIIKFATNSQVKLWDNAVNHIRTWHENGARPGRMFCKQIKGSPDQFQYGKFTFELLGKKCKCSECGFMAAQNPLRKFQYILDHILEEHVKIQRKYRCRFCRKLYSTSTGCNSHEQIHHSQHMKKVLGDKGQHRKRTRKAGPIQVAEHVRTSEEVTWPPKGIVIPADTPSVKRVSTNKFTYQGEFQFEGTDFGFKCLSCPFITKFATGPLSYLWFNIVSHIKEWHFDATRLAAKTKGKPQSKVVQVAPDRFLHGGIPFIKLENGQYECGDCGFRPVVNPQKSNQNILKHILQKHLQTSEEYVCEVCGKELKSRLSLRSHKLIHNEPTEDQLLSCSMCNKKFKLRRGLRSHMKKVHGGEDAKKNICEVCGKRFSTAYQLGSHKFSHTGVRTFKCRECGKMFAAYAALYTHQHSHTGKKFTCDICGMDFTQHYSVTRHKKTAHPQ